MKLPALPWPVWVAVAGVAALALWRLSGRTFADLGQTAGSAAVDAAGGVVAGVAFGVGDAIGLPRADESECDRALREGRLWDASFKCPAGRFLSASWGRITD